MIVMKFGGTSVADAAAIRALAGAVRAADEPPVVVVSALAKVTDTLLALAQAVESDDRPAFEATLDALTRRHHAVAADLGAAGEEIAAMDATHAELAAFLRERLGRVLTPADRDRLAGAGELLSSRLVTAALRLAGLDAVWCDARDLVRTDAQFGGAIPDEAAIAEATRMHLAPLLAAGRLPVTQGFIGRSQDGEPTTLGRGGSDFSAALLGAALGASRVEIWTDVDGLMTADPRIVPEAQILPSASYDEAAELAAFGAKVLHPATQLPLVAAAIPIVIRNTFAADRPGTRITALPELRADRPVRSISLKRGVTVVHVRAARMLGAYGFLRRIFEVFERHRIVVDVLATSEVSVSLTVDDPTRVPGAAQDLAAIGEVAVRPGRGVVAVVGAAIRETAGVAARVYTAIADVNVEMISQGASVSNLTFVVREEDGPRVVQALHRTFFPEST